MNIRAVMSMKLHEIFCQYFDIRICQENRPLNMVSPPEMGNLILDNQKKTPVSA